MRLAAILLFMTALASAQSAIDPELKAYIATIKAVDNHAHPVSADPNDKDYDALPVENLEPSSDPLRLRPTSPEVADAWRALYGADNAKAAAEKKAALKNSLGPKYPAWVLDQVGIETMVANRVAMGLGVQPPRFRWVPYLDALIFPLDNSKLADATPDRKQLFPLEKKVLTRYLAALKIQQIPGSLDEYLRNIVTPTLEAQKQGGAIAVKFEAAYLRSLDFADPTRDQAQAAYREGLHAALPADRYKPLQDFLFRYIAAECGRLGMAVHIHSYAGGGSYFVTAGANPLLLEPVFNDPKLRKTNFVLVHGGWPYTREVGPLLIKPNVYVDFSAQSFTEYPRRLAQTLREWLELVPEKVMFGTDSYPFADEMNWEEMAWMTSRVGREALGMALTGMLQDGEIDRPRAQELARMVLRGNAIALYRFQ